MNLEPRSTIKVSATPAPPVVTRHVETCLRCQAELVQYRKVLRALHQLRTEVLEPAPGLFTDILTSLEGAGEEEEDAPAARVAAEVA